MDLDIHYFDGPKVINVTFSVPFSNGPNKNGNEEIKIKGEKKSKMSCHLKCSLELLSLVAGGDGDYILNLLLHSSIPYKNLTNPPNIIKSHTYIFLYKNLQFKKI